MKSNILVLGIRPVCLSICSLGRACSRQTMRFVGYFISSSSYRFLRGLIAVRGNSSQLDAQTWVSLELVNYLIVALNNLLKSSQLSPACAQSNFVRIEC